MKILFGTVIFLVLSISWICAAEQTEIPADLNERGQQVTTELASTDSQDLELIVPAHIAEEDLEQALTQEIEEANAIKPEVRPTKRPKRPHGNKRPTFMEHKPQHQHNPMSLPESWPYFPMPAQMPYSSPCSYPQPIFYPMPMYSPYFFPAQIHSEKNSPASSLQMDSAESTESEEEVNAENLLRKGNWNNRHENKWGSKNTTDTAKPTKHFLIRNWVTNKLNKKKTSEAVPPEANA